MRVTFPAALDAIAADLPDCPTRRWRGAMQRQVAAMGSDAPAWPMRVAELALCRAVAGRIAGDEDDLRAPWSAFPVFAWQTPTGVELGFSTLSPMVRRHLATGDDPGALATGADGWRTELSVLRSQGGLARLKLRDQLTVGWTEFTALREALLDLLADRRTPLLARLAAIASVHANTLSNRALPDLAAGGGLEPLHTRNYLAFRAFLESRCAAADAEALGEVLRQLEPLCAGDAGLGAADAAQVCEALLGDWRADLGSYVAAVERELAPAIESVYGLWLFGTPLQRDVSLLRGWAELGEKLAFGLRFAAAIGAAQGAPLDALQMTTALALGEAAVATLEPRLPLLQLPTGAHERAPRMVDLDMTLASIA